MAIPSERTLPEILQGVIGNLQEIIRSEFQLAKTEVKEGAAKASGPATTIAVGLFISLYAFGFLLLAAVYGLSTVAAPWLAALIVGAVLALLGTIFINSGKSKLKQVNDVTEKSTESLKEDMTWAKRQMK